MYAAVGPVPYDVSNDKRSTTYISVSLYESMTYILNIF